ncbi:MAG TPA: 50S ribosomal protein L23 [Candidatus Babeliales bacterium]|nr:50S ribosomal protein L23 [Candidatus Babeliales bacterium]
MGLKSIYHVIQGPVISDKAYRLNRTLNQLVLRVHPEANKPMIKEALKKLFNVEAEAVRIVTRKGKKRRAGKKEVWGPDEKKALVTLKEGQSLNLFDQAGGRSSVADEQKEIKEDSI